MFGLDIPSTIEFKMPDWRGDFHVIGGWAQDRAEEVWSEFKAVADPVKKEAADLEDSALSAVRGVYAGGKSVVTAAFGAATSGLKETISAVVSPITGSLSDALGLKWVGIIVALGAVAYFFMIAPRNRNA